jgi:hypothetical protein
MRRGIPGETSTRYTLLLSVCVVLCGSASVAAPAKAGARIDKPVSLTVSGGSCENDGKGNIGASFGDALSFNIGPATAGGSFLGMSMARYRGPGAYHKVLISGYPDKAHAFFGLGTIMVNADRQTGTFVTDDGTASGSWNCGTPLK